MLANSALLSVSTSLTRFSFFLPTVVSFALLGILGACGAQQSPKDLQSLTSDVSVPKDGKTFLLHSKGTQIIAGQCLGSEILTPANCPQQGSSESSVLSRSVELRLETEREVTDGLIEKEIQNLINQDPIIRGFREQQTSLQKAIDEVQKTILPERQKRIQELEDLMFAYCEKSTFLKAQLDAVQLKLNEDPNNEELQVLKVQLTTQWNEVELLKFQNLGYLDQAKLAVLESDTLLKEKNAELVETTDWLKARLEGFKPSSDSLASLRQKQTLLGAAQSELPALFQKVISQGLAFRYEMQTSASKISLQYMLETLLVPAEFVKTGLYLNQGPYSSFCNQSIHEAKIDAGKLKSLTMSFCQSTRYTFTCESNTLCIGTLNDGVKRTLTIFSLKAYEFAEGSNKARFELKE